MKCDVCGGVMVWRCTNTNTRLSKWKCKGCGHIHSMVLPEPKNTGFVKPTPKYYFQDGDKFIVKKKRNYQTIYIGKFNTEEMAKKVVKGMLEVDWDKDLIPEVFNALGIVKVNRQWCYA